MSKPSKPTFFQTFAIIKDMVANLEQGEALPAERQLADMIGAARTVVREAKAALWALEVITIEQGKPSKKL